MRLFLAAVFVFGGILLAVVLLSHVIKHVSPILGSLVVGLGMSILFVVLVIIALVLFNGTWEKARDFKSMEEHIKELDEKGLLVSNDFHAVRAFEVEEGEDEGPHYFIELAGGSVLYLNGQYLYD